MSNDTTASTSTIRTWQERTHEDKWAQESTAYMEAEITDLRAALARAPLPAQAMDEEVNAELCKYRMALEIIGVKDCADPAKVASETLVETGFWNAAKANEFLSAAPAQADDARDAERLDWLDQNIFHREMDDWDQGAYPNHWMWVMFAPKGTQGTARDIIDAAIAASLAGKDKP